MAGFTFAVDIHRDLQATDLGWYSPNANAQESLGVNRRYEDLRAFSWEDVEHILEIEREVIAKIEGMTFDDGSDEDADSAAVQILETLDSAQDTWSFWGPPYGLDLGVASSVIAVSAARCVPFASCNAGAFGGHHPESYPCVVLYMRPQLLPLLMACAE